MAKEIYLHNSKHKETIRAKWVEFSNDILKDNKILNIITFPAEEMQDLQLFVDEGLLKWEVTETGAYKINSDIYKVICFEKSDIIYLKLTKKLVGAIVVRDEIGSYLRSKYQALMNKASKIFPIDVINLDYDGNISKNKVPITETIELIFKCQALHKKNFSLFITWPHTENEDEQAYKDLLKKIIEDNLEDPQAVSFKTIFDKSFDSVEKLDYEQLSIIGLSKIIIQNSSSNKFSLDRNEFYIYGEENKRRMFSVLMNFNYQNAKAKHTIYSADVHKTLNDAIDLSIAKKA